MKELQEYMEKYRSRIFLMGLLVFLFHGAKLFSGSIGIDTEDIINLGEDFYNGWLTTGRQGLVGMKTALGSLWYNPYFAGMLTLVCLTAGVFSFFRLLEYAAEKEHAGCGKSSMAGWMAGSMLLLSHPILTEQLYFALQSVEICLGFLFTAVSLLFVLKWEEKQKPLWFAGGALLLVLVFSMYQAFVPLYIFGAAALLLTQGMREKNMGTLLERMLRFMAVFFTGFLVNTIVTRLFFSGSSYLQGQIFWGKVSPMENFRLILGHIVKTLTGYDSIYYSPGYGLLWAVTLILFFLVLRKKEYGKKRKLLLLFFLAAVFAAPFLMTVVCGGAPAVRSQLVLPFLTGFLGWFDCYLSGLLREKTGEDNRTDAGRVKASSSLRARLTKTVIGLVCLAAALMQLQVSMRLYYTDDCRYGQDVSLARDLITRIEQVRGKEKLPVVFIGKKEFQGNPACVQGEVIGRSFFDYDTEAEPQFFWSTRRILGFFRILGQDYGMVTADRLPEAVEYSTYMPEWPAENSVQIHEGMIVVKLSHFE